MRTSFWLLSAGLAALAMPAQAQEQDPTADGGPSADAAATEAGPGLNEDIIVTATRRSQTLSNVPIAVSAVTGDALQNAGATDIRGLNQLSPSLLVSSSSSEAVGGVARIRGIGTVGDNPGLESSVATFIDGVYRSRSGVALTELGAVERIEVLRGPQGTLFGRNASAGLINVITAQPKFEEEGTAELSYGNYDMWRGLLGLTGPIGDSGVAYRVDGVYMKRDGFLKDSNNYPGSTDRRFNGRDRWLVRGQLLYEPNDALTVRLIGDYADRDEECCAATYLPTRDVVRNADGSITYGPSSFAAFERQLGAVINEDTFGRRVSVTPDRSYQSDVRDWGLSGEINYDFGGARLTSITAYRDWRSDRGQDADFNNLDILYRTNYDQQFSTFTQELRLQGEAMGDRLDWLVGAYFGAETLDLVDNLRFGRDYGLVEGCRVVAGVIPALGLPAATLSPASPGCINPAIRPGIAAALGPFAPGILGSLDRLRAIGDSGATLDDYRQKDRTWALFTHNVFNVTDQLAITLGARYTHDRKTLDASLASDSNVCGVQTNTSNALATQIAGAAAGGLVPAAQAAQLIGVLRNVQALACANNIGGTANGTVGVDGSYDDKVSDSEWTGTAVLSFKPTDRMLTYASYSRGFKAGGFNLDRAGLNVASPSAAQLRFAPETVDAFEIGAKYRGRGFRFAAAAFYELFQDFQLNTFNGISFIVENIRGCSDLAGGSGADTDLSDTTGACSGKDKSGVVSKGIELEAGLFPADDFAIDLGFTLADTKYRDDLSGINDRPLPSALFLLPGSRLSNAPQYVVTGGTTWTPKLGGNGLGALVHADFRYQSEINTGSDLLTEKAEEGVMVVNGRVGITGPDNRWSLEVWGQNLFDVDYKQVVASAPVQGSGSDATVRAGGTSPGNSLFIVFPAEPRLYGVTVRTRF